ERGGRRGVDDPHAGSGHLDEFLAQQGIVRAAEQERVDDRRDDTAFGEKRLDVGAHGGERLGGPGLPLLDDGHELWTRLLDHVGEWIEVPYGTHVRAGPDGARRREHADGATARRRER